MSAFPLKADIRSHLNERFRAFLFPVCRHINYENNQLSANLNFKNQFKNPLPKKSFSILKIKAQFFLNSHSIVIITSNMFLRKTFLSLILTSLSWTATAQDTDTIPNIFIEKAKSSDCLLYTSPSPRDGLLSRMPSSA